MIVRGGRTPRRVKGACIHVNHITGPRLVGYVESSLRGEACNSVCAAPGREAVRDRKGVITGRCLERIIIAAWSFKEDVAVSCLEGIVEVETVVSAQCRESAVPLRRREESAITARLESAVTATRLEGIITATRPESTIAASCLERIIATRG